MRTKIGKKRFWELDLLRGIFVILMLFDHFMFSSMSLLPTFSSMFGVKDFWQGLSDFADYYWRNPVKEIIHYIAIAAFMLLCGISCTLSRSNLKRGLIAALAAITITIVTSILEKMLNYDGLTIYFGVIHLLSSAMLIYYVLQIPSLLLDDRLIKLGKRKKTVAKLSKTMLRLIPAFVGLGFLLAFFLNKWGEFALFDNDYGQKFIHLKSNVTIDLERRKLYKDFMSIILNLKNYHEISGGDYFPLLPYAALVLTGGFIGELIYKNRKKTDFNPKITAPITYVGRHALIFYLAHQVIIAAFFFIAVLLRSKI